jgi:hypothetical protein
MYRWEGRNYVERLRPRTPVRNLSPTCITPIYAPALKETRHLVRILRDNEFWSWLEHETPDETFEVLLSLNSV